MLYDIPDFLKDEVLRLSQKYYLDIDEVDKLYKMGGDNHAELLCHMKSMGASDKLLMKVNADMWERYTRYLIVKATEPPTFNEALRELFILVCEELGIVRLAEWLTKKLKK